MKKNSFDTFLLSRISIIRIDKKKKKLKTVNKTKAIWFVR